MLKHPNRQLKKTSNSSVSGLTQPLARPRGRSRLWAFRIAALLIAPLLFIGALETSLRLAHYGYSPHFFRTLEIGGKRMVVENDDFSLRFFPRELARHPLPISFSEGKPPGTYRIFVLGESAAMGDPDPAFGFSRVLEVLLRERFPGMRFEVINVAFTAINSHVILPIARDCAQHEGDLWLIYMGHNEVQGPFGPGTVFGAHRSRLWLTRASLAVKATKVGQLLEALQGRFRSPKTNVQRWQGLEMFLQNQIPSDDPRLESMSEQFQANLEDILKTARGAGAKVILCSPASNLKDSAPFASLHRAGLSDPQKASWNDLFQRGITNETQHRCKEALSALEAAAAIDSHYADLQFRLGSCELELNQRDQAEHSFELARDFDSLRFRADSRLIDVIGKEASKWQGKGVYFCDTRKEIAQGTVNGIPGDDLFYDHVHLRFDGNYLLAKAMADQVSALLTGPARGRDTGGWVDANTCAERLGLTDWHTYQMTDLMQRRLLEAPFTNQLNHLARQQQFSKTLASLRPSLQSEGLLAAVKICRDALSHAPDDPVLHENLAKLLAAIGQDIPAAVEFKRVTELWPQDAAAFNNVGVLLQKEGKPAEAEAYFRQALLRRSDFADAQNGLGLVAAARGDFRTAAARYQEALQINPDLVEARVNLGLVFQQQGDLPAASACYNEALRIRPNFVPAHLGLAEVLLKEGQAFEAIPHLGEAASLQPESTLGKVNRGVQLHPGEALEHFKRASVLAALKKSDEALKSLSTAVQLNTNFWEAHYLLGVELAQNNQLAEAEEQFLAVVQLKPDYARAHLNLGVALARQNHLHDAADQFKDVLRLEPTNQMAQVFLQKIVAMSDTNRVSQLGPVTE